MGALDGLRQHHKCSILCVGVLFFTDIIHVVESHTCDPCHDYTPCDGDLTGEDWHCLHSHKQVLKIAKCALAGKYILVP